MEYNIPEDATDVAYYTDLGGYSLFYVSTENDTWCPGCVCRHIECCKDKNDPNYIVAMAINWEDSNLHCDCCGGQIQSSYSED